MNRILCKTLFQAWPFPFGHVRIMQKLNPPRLDFNSTISHIRGYNGKLKYDPNSYIGRYLYYRGIFEEQLIAQMARQLRPGMTVVDVGANIGLHTVVAAGIVGNTGRVISVEPQSRVREALTENVELNHLQNVTIVATGLGRSPQKSQIFHVNPANDGQATLRPDAHRRDRCTAEEIDIRTLENVLQEQGVSKVDVLKIDVEGSEMDVLEGASNWLDSNRPGCIFVECIDAHLRKFGSSSAELVEWLVARDYEVLGLVRGRWRPVSPAAGLNLDLMAKPVDRRTS